MKFINPIFKSKKVNQYIADLINDYEYTKYSDLTFSDRYYLAGLLIETLDTNSAIECITESNNLDLTIKALKECLLGHTKDLDMYLALNIKVNTVRYYDETMKALFEEGYSEQYAAREATAYHFDEFIKSKYHHRERL